MAKQVRFVNQPLVPGQAIADVAAFDTDGNPVTVGGPAGSPTPADGSVTTAKLADGAVTAAKIAAGVIPTVPAAPTWATISGKPAPAAAIADVTADGTVTPAQFNAVLAALRSFGVIAAK